MEKTSELAKFYQNRMYGQWRSGEEVSYTVSDGGEVTIEVAKGDRKTSFTVTMFLPQPDAAAKYPTGSPFIVCMHPIMPKDYALEQGYAVFFMNVYAIASDNTEHKGCFYDIYPYGEEHESQTGALMAWAWALPRCWTRYMRGSERKRGLM